MRVLIVGVDYFHYASSLVRACEMLGNQVMNFWITEFKDSKNSYWKIRSSKLGMKFFEHKYNEKMNKEFIKLAKSFKPDYCIVINGKDVNRHFLVTLKDLSVKSVLFMVDSIKSAYLKRSIEQIHYYDKVFSYEPSDIKFLSENYKYQNAKYLFVGYDETIFNFNEPYEKKYDLCFAGTLNKKRFDLLERVAKYAYENDKKMIIYTKPLYTEKNIVHKVRNYFRANKIKTKYPYLIKFLVDTPICNDRLADLYRRTRVCINIHSEGDLHTGPNPRTFEILGCGSFELVDVNHLKQVKLKSRQHLVEFEEASDLCEKIEYYLTHDEARERIAANGYKLAKDNYSMRKCVDRILIEFENNKNN